MTNGVDSTRGTGSLPPASAEEEASASSKSPSMRPSSREKVRDLLDFADQLSATEQKQIKFVRSTFEPGVIDRAVRVAQRYIGSNWIEYCTRNIRHVHGLERLPKFDPKMSYLVVANHRSFFDLYVLTG
jgi:1-acyl-sn-glycerol-3-phosphate acyltransferase